jgi:hypothetical protein
MIYIYTYIYICVLIWAHGVQVPLRASKAIWTMGTSTFFKALWGYVYTYIYIPIIGNVIGNTRRNTTEAPQKHRMKFA